jgi:hypothetical protein
MPAANVPSVSATPLCQTWRKRFFGRLSASEPHSSRTPSMNVQPATCATSASNAAPIAIISAELWVSAVLARIASSQSYSAISWTWRYSTPTLPSIVVTVSSVAACPRLLNPQRRANGRGHAALLPQSLDNRLRGYPHDHPRSDDDGRRSLFSDIPFPPTSDEQPVLVIHNYCRSVTQSGKSSPRRRQI